MYTDEAAGIGDQDARRRRRRRAARPRRGRSPRSSGAASAPMSANGSGGRPRRRRRRARGTAPGRSTPAASSGRSTGSAGPGWTGISPPTSGKIQMKSTLKPWPGVSCPRDVHVVERIGIGGVREVPDEHAPGRRGRARTAAGGTHGRCSVAPGPCVTDRYLGAIRWRRTEARPRARTSLAGGQRRQHVHQQSRARDDRQRDGQEPAGEPGARRHATIASAATSASQSSGENWYGERLRTSPTWSRSGNDR